MGTLWLKIKIWTKTIVVLAAATYATLFVLNNSGQPVTIWYWFRKEYSTSMLVLLIGTFLAGVVGTLLVRATFTTIRQIRELRERNRISRLERDNADMKAKAAMLQTRTSASSATEPAPMSSKATMTNDQ
jgi:hypothetical protein